MSTSPAVSIVVWALIFFGGFLVLRECARVARAALHGWRARRWFNARARIKGRIIRIGTVRRVGQTTSVENFIFDVSNGALPERIDPKLGFIICGYSFPELSEIAARRAEFECENAPGYASEDDEGEGWKTK